MDNNWPICEIRYNVDGNEYILQVPSREAALHALGCIQQAILMYAPPQTLLDTQTAAIIEAGQSIFPSGFYINWENKLAIRNIGYSTAYILDNKVVCKKDNHTTLRINCEKQEYVLSVGPEPKSIRNK